MVNQIANTLKGTEIIGHDVVSLENGEKIDKVEEILYEPETNSVRALQIGRGGIFSNPKVLLLENIKSIGKDVVIIENTSVLKSLSEIDESISKIAKVNNYLTETMIVSEDGNQLGKITDIYFDFPSGKVEEFEVSEGGIKDLKSGKKGIRVTDIVTVGKDATIVRTETEQIMREQEKTQGLTGAINDIKAKTPGIIEVTKEKVAEASQKAKIKAENAASRFNEWRESDETKGKFERIQQDTKKTIDSVREKYSDTEKELKENRKSGAIGKYLETNILGPNDQFIAYRGDLITHSLLQDAENMGVLDVVLSNASTKPIAPEESPVVHLNMPPNRK